jgi:hypothetical protein
LLAVVGHAAFGLSCWSSWAMSDVSVSQGGVNDGVDGKHTKQQNHFTSLFFSFFLSIVIFEEEVSGT